MGIAAAVVRIFLMVVVIHARVISVRVIRIHVLGMSRITVSRRRKRFTWNVG